MLKKSIFLIILFLILKISAYCQNEPNLTLLTNATDYKLQERVLLTLDQDLYLAGEQINFSALTFDSALRTPIEFSSILYMELFNQDKNVISAKKYLLKNGQCINKIALPRQLETGYYYIRAYTNYMKNVGASAFYTQKIKVINPFYKIKYQDNVKSTANKIKLNIASEGGKLIFGLENKVAFYTQNLNDSISAHLLKNDTIISTNNAKNGFGIFCFNPTIGNRYRIEATSSKKGKTAVELNDMVDSGVICKLDSINNQTGFFKISTKNFNKFPISVFVENNAFMYGYSKKIENSSQLFTLNLLIGTNKIILKNNENEEVSSRTVYIKPTDGLEFSAKLNKNVVLPGDSVTLNINTNKIDSVKYIVTMNLGNQLTSPALSELIESFHYGLPTESTFYNELKTVLKNSKNINDYLIQQENVPTYIHNLNSIKYLPETNSCIVTGNVFKQSDKSVAKNKEIYLSFVDSISWTNRAKTDNFGKFTAALPIEYQGNKLIISVKDTAENYLLKLDDEFFPDFSNIIKESFYPDFSLKKVIESRMINLQINDAYSALNKNTPSYRPNVRFYGNFDTEYKFKKFLVPNLEEFISEIAQKASIVKKGKSIEVRVFKTTDRSVIGERPLIILDGIPIQNFDKIASISAEKFESIRLVTKQFFFGTEVYDGIVDISSKSKAFDLIEPEKNSIKVFFSPVVTSNEEFHLQNSRVPNYQSNLLFKKIDSPSGNESIKLKLPQNTGSYSLSIIGYTNNGEFGYFSAPEILTIKR
jgi:hypothetical protein